MTNHGKSTTIARHRGIYAPFEIIGNQENPIGNPLGYHRTTQGGLWNKGSKRYAAWKQYVMAAFLKTNRLDTLLIELGDVSVRVDIFILWANEKHADCDNVFKGILDALFKNDKGVAAGSFESARAGDGVGRVCVEIKNKIVTKLANKTMTEEQKTALRYLLDYVERRKDKTL